MGYKYKPSSQVTWEQSPAYNVKVYRNPETIAKEQAMEDFMYWLEYDAEMKSEKQAENLVKFLKPLMARLQLTSIKKKKKQVHLLTSSFLIFLSRPEWVEKKLLKNSGNLILQSKE